MGRILPDGSLEKPIQGVWGVRVGIQHDVVGNQEEGSGHGCAGTRVCAVSKSLSIWNTN